MLSKIKYELEIIGRNTHDLSYIFISTFVLTMVAAAINFILERLRWAGVSYEYPIHHVTALIDSMPFAALLSSLSLFFCLGILVVGEESYAILKKPAEMVTNTMLVMFAAFSGVTVATSIGLMNLSLLVNIPRLAILIIFGYGLSKLVLISSGRPLGWPLRGLLALLSGVFALIIPALMTVS